MYFFVTIIKYVFEGKIVIIVLREMEFIGKLKVELALSTNESYSGRE